MAGNRLLANEVPIDRETREPIRAATGQTGKDKEGLSRVETALQPG
jgi:hypothetical protein